MKCLTDKPFWEETWRRHIESYLARPPRAGHFVRTMFGRYGHSVLEIAGGSCRDSRYLAQKGWEATASDFDEKTLAYLKARFQENKPKLCYANALELPFPDATFDVTFHNGFWIYFQSDTDINRMAAEQFRVTKRAATGFLHNGRNRCLIETFARKAETDKLYAIRFFDPDEVYEILRTSGARPGSIHIYKFGGRVDQLHNPKVKGLPNPLWPVAGRVIPHLYQAQPWANTERIVFCVSL